VKGTVVRPCAIDYEKVSFAGANAIAQGSIVTAHFIRVAVSDPRTSVEASCSPSDGTLILNKGESNCDYSVAVAPSSNRPCGPFNYPVTIDVKNVAGALIHRETIVVHGSVTSRYYFAPDELRFGSKMLRQEHTADVILFCPDVASIDFSTSMPNFRVEQVGDPTPTARALRITVIPNSVGETKCTITASFALHPNKQEHVELPVSIYGAIANDP
jgi:hypothetical protein